MILLVTQSNENDSIIHHDAAAIITAERPKVGKATGRSLKSSQEVTVGKNATARGYVIARVFNRSQWIFNVHKYIAGSQFEGHTES